MLCDVHVPCDRQDCNCAGYCTHLLLNRCKNKYRILVDNGEFSVVVQVAIAYALISISFIYTAFHSKLVCPGNGGTTRIVVSTDADIISQCSASENVLSY